MKYLTLVLSILLGLFMIFGGVNHFLKPDFYLPFVPPFLPLKEVIVLLSGVVEVVLGVGVLIPKFRFYAAWGILLLMLVFLPVHIYDLFIENPAIGSHKAAWIRLPFQFLFIAWAWAASKYTEK